MSFLPDCDVTKADEVVKPRVEQTVKEVKMGDEKVKGKKGQDTALPKHNLLRGTLVVSIIAAYIVGILMLGKRR